MLKLLNNRKRTAYLSSQIGETLEIVIEEEVPYQGMVGTSSNYLKITVNSKRYPKKSLVSVRVTERAGDGLRGIPVQNM
jgi:tRNA A37 methylthiotransferase MiaB